MESIDESASCYTSRVYSRVGKGTKGNERERNEKEGDANTTGGGCVHDTRGGDWARLVESAGITLEKLSPHRITTRLALVSTHAMH